MTSPAPARLHALLAGLFLLLLGAILEIPAQPADELIDRLLALSKEKPRVAAGEDELRRLLVQRYNIALDELKETCQDFRRNLATKATVFEAGRHLLQADLEMQTGPEGRVRVLEKALDLLRWYEKRLEQAHRDRLIPRADLLRTRYQRLSLEIKLLEAKRAGEVRERR